VKRPPRLPQVNNGEYSGVAASPAPVAAALLQQLFSSFGGESLSAGGLQQLLEAHQAWAKGQLQPEPQTMQQQLQQRLAELRRQQQQQQASKQQQQQRPGDDGEPQGVGVLPCRERCSHLRDTWRLACCACEQGSTGMLSSSICCTAGEIQREPQQAEAGGSSRGPGEGPPARTPPLQQLGARLVGGPAPHLLQLLASDKGLLLAWADLAKGIRWVGPGQQQQPGLRARACLAAAAAAAGRKRGGRCKGG
jgi:hypothetical protein